MSSLPATTSASQNWRSGSSSFCHPVNSVTLLWQLPPESWITKRRDGNMLLERSLGSSTRPQSKVELGGTWRVEAPNSGLKHSLEVPPAVRITQCLTYLIIASWSAFQRALGRHNSKIKVMNPSTWTTNYALICSVLPLTRSNGAEVRGSSPKMSLGAFGRVLGRLFTRLDGREFSNIQECFPEIRKAYFWYMCISIITIS